MQRFDHLVTTVAFAAHAILGCGAHYACEHGLAIAGGSTADASHHCAADHHDEPQQPAHDHQHPASPCQHAACSFVKADTVRIDQPERHIDWVAPAASAESAQPGQFVYAACEPLGTAGHSSAQLYVWHCALLI